MIELFCPQPLYGLIEAKLELITHAYFKELDFSQVALLEETYNNLNASLTSSLLDGGSQVSEYITDIISLQWGVAG